MTTDGLPPEAYAAALAGFPGMWPARLRKMLQQQPPFEVWRSVAGDAPPNAGVAEAIRRTPDLPARWRAHAGRHPPEQVWTRCATAGVAVHLLGWSGYPDILAADREAPAVLFSRGDLDALDGRRVAVIGTRNTTATGRDVARELGAGLAAAGVRVVSGLARGIDGAAHRGALSAHGAPPVGVVACGLDVVYPGEHRDLWSDVAARGVLLAEVPPGTSPEGYRFPLRNRILAAVSELVVVVESRAAGGSLVTVEAAERRGIPVLAVPGSPRNVAAEGTNRLIADGATPVLDVTDVLVALGLSSERTRRRPGDDRPPPEGDDAVVLALFGDQPLDLQRVQAHSGLTIDDSALALARLEVAGWLMRTGGWFERAPGGVA
jgi:DNA processing protein